MLTSPRTHPAPCYPDLAVFPQLQGGGTHPVTTIWPSSLNSGSPPHTHTISRMYGFSFQRRSRLSSSALSLSTALCLSFRGRFGSHSGGPGPRKYTKFIQRDINFKHFEVFASKPSPERENEPKRTSKDTQNTPQADPEQPRRGQE